MDDQTIQVIIGLLIGAGYLIVTIVKKVDRWIQTHRVPPEYRQQQQSSEQSRPARGEPSPRPMPDLGTLLRRELEKVLRGGEEEPASPVYAAPPKPKPMPAAPAPSRSRALPGLAGPRQAAALMQTAAASKEAMISRKGTGHLTAIRSFADAKRAIIMHEILQPPLAMRRRGGALRQPRFQ